MKKIVSIVLSLVMVIGMASATYAAEIKETKSTEYKGYICTRENEPKEMTLSVYKYQYTYENENKGENDFIPLREVCESLGMKVEWNGEKQSIKITREDFKQNYEFVVGQDGVILIDGNTYIEASLIPTNVGNSSRDENSYNFYFDNTEKEILTVQG